ncbi:MAG: hypothetical protein LBS35_14895, partial [Synergistaceae bacterium]|nr:hypothetical protein [Synergistaceae bacterium]
MSKIKTGDVKCPSIFNNTIKDMYEKAFEKKCEGETCGMQKAIIAIPIYKKALTKAEEASLKRCFKVFYKYVISFFGPVNLETEYYEQIAGSHSHYIERFPCDYFSSL